MTSPSKIACLVFGVAVSLGAALWCVGGAGMFGSPLAGESDRELAHVWAFLVIGPFSALPAAIVSLWKPRWGAIWLIAGGIVSGALAIPYFSTDAGVVPLVLVPLPMLLLGMWLILRAQSAVRSIGH